MYTEVEIPHLEDFSRKIMYRIYPSILRASIIRRSIFLFSYRNVRKCKDHSSINSDIQTIIILTDTLGMHLSDLAV